MNEDGTITVTIGDMELTMSEEEAEELHLKLNSIVGIKLSTWPTGSITYPSVKPEYYITTTTDGTTINLL